MSSSIIMSDPPQDAPTAVTRIGNDRRRPIANDTHNPVVLFVVPFDNNVRIITPHQVGLKVVVRRLKTTTIVDSLFMWGLSRTILCNRKRHN